MSNLIHDVIKIRYVDEGYLPNIPYHLISDAEMCDAFIKDSEDEDFWTYYYPLPSEYLQTQYDELKSAILWHIDQLKTSTDPSYSMPDWVYSYMLGNVLSVNSSIYDLHYLLVMLDADNINDVFTPIAAAECYKVSKNWLGKIPTDQLDHRPPTIFGEPHVIKALRLQQVAVSSMG